MKARISEVFDSIQGEGLYFGEKQIFVRFFGCNLSCRFCDTKLDRFREYDPEELINEIDTYEDSYHSISFTGGEPLLHKEFLSKVLRLTHQAGFKNYLETNGTLPGELESVIDGIDIVAMDLKLPSSTGMGDLWGLHKKFLKIASAKDVFLKAIICQGTSEDDLKQALEVIKSVNGSAMLVLQPNSFENNQTLIEKLENFKNLCRDEQVSACIIPQMHKVMGVK
ncbi:MAG: 7-carboxy-7-deazaguanine synthase QueE [Candidatus Omnitrophica bacterium]|nr:7-carboxy-7-deazaguanine synthase QueE [Candidatus Omnitrophota bacterium]